MADTMIQLVLNELSRVVREEVGLLLGVKEEIEKVRKELEVMKAFLRSVDDQKEKHPMLQTWVGQVREVAFEIEDVVDEYLLRVPYGDDASRAHNSCLGRIFSIFKNWKAKHQIGSELRNITAKVKEVSERSKRYESPQSQGSSSVGDYSYINQYRRSIVTVDQSKLVGINESKQKLVELLNDGDPNLKIVAIVGMGGLGKTALARQIYSKEPRFKRWAFATVSQTFNEEEFLKEILEQLSYRERLEMQQFSRNRLREEVRERLMDECYMIVVDDLWNTEHWDQIKGLFPTNNKGSRVVITTRKMNVARRGDRVYRLQPLSEEASWDLFCKNAFSSQRCPSNLEPICKDIVFNKCKGVPIAILAISGILRGKDERDVNAWVKVQQSLHIEVEENEELEMTKKILSLSFDELLYHLKPCYMYLCVFPEDRDIRWTRVIGLWVSEGFVEKREGRTLEEDADNYLCEFANRNLIQTLERGGDGTGRVKYFRIHDFLRDIILAKSKEERFVEIIRKAETREVKARRISVHQVNDAIRRLPLLLRIRSLLMFTYGTSPIILPDDAFKFKLLNVLDLENALLDSFPDEICSLVLLRYLSLRRTRISNLPKSIGKLGRLEFLDLKYTFLAELPNEILILGKLRHLGVCRKSGDPVKVTGDIGSLASLQRLSFIEVPVSSEWLKALGSLKQLRKLGLANLKEQQWRELCLCISNLTNLRSLVLHTIGSFELEHLRSPPPSLERLHLDGQINEIPDWVSPSSLGNLQALKLHNTRLKKNPGTSLQSLPNLMSLFLFKAFDDGIKMQVVPPHSFPSLREFVIREDGISVFHDTRIDERTWTEISHKTNRIMVDNLIDHDKLPMQK